jgi:hypothetical protein
MILAVGWSVIWFFLRHANRTERVSFFGFRPTFKADDPNKFAKVVRNYRMQMIALPFIAAVVAWSMELP